MSEDRLEQLLSATLVVGGHDATSCPDELAVAGYVDGGLSIEARESFERHLVGCDECVRLVAFLSRAAGAPAVSQVPRELVQRAEDLFSSGRSRPVLGRPANRRWLAMAAGLLLATTVVLWKAQDQRAPDASSRTRWVESGTPGPRVLLPIEGSTVPSGPLRIRWSAQPSGLFYEVRVVDGDGDLLWQSRVEGTDVVLPENLGLISGEDYFVRVSAHLAGGKTLQSRHVGFRVGEDP